MKINWDNRYIFYSLIVFLSLSLSSIKWIYRQPFNVDGIIYLQAAQAFLSQGLKAAFDVYSWPFYSLLIAWVHILTTLPLEACAYLLNNIFYIILITGFFHLANQLALSEKASTKYWAIVVILLFPYLNRLRADILRDPGYYAFFLLSLIYFIRYWRYGSWSVALGWNICIALACLFRIEGVILAMLVPLGLIFNPNWNKRQRLIQIIKLATIPFIISLLIVFLDTLNQLNFPHNRLFALSNLMSSLGQKIVLSWKIKMDLIERLIINPHSAPSTGFFIGFGVIGIWLSSLLRTMGNVYFVLAILSLRSLFRLIKVKLINRNFIIPVSIYIAANFIITIFFLAENFFIAERYLISLVLLVLLPLPLWLNSVFGELKNNQLKDLSFYHLLVGLGLAWNLISSVSHYGTSKTYLIDAGEWLNRHMPNHSLLYTKNPEVYYYSHRKGMDYPQDFMNYLTTRKSFLDFQPQELNGYYYYAFQLSRFETKEITKLIKYFNALPEKVFSNKKGDQIVIFKDKNL